MRILTRYILRLYLSILGISLFGFLGLYLVIDFFEKIDDILEKNASFADAARYFALKIPFILTQGIPMMALITTLICFSILQRNREIVAMKAAGLSLRSYGGPVILAAILIAAVHFGIGENIARTMTSQAQRIWAEKIDHKKAHLEWRHENIWYHGKHIIYQVKLYNQAEQTFHRVTLFYLDDHFRLKRRLDAEKLRWKNGIWLAENGLSLDFRAGKVKQDRFAIRRLHLREKPQDFAAIEALPEELSWIQLYRYNQRMKQEGYASPSLEVELHFRIAFPLTTLLLTIIGMAISLRQGVHGRITVGVIMALAVGSFYLALLQVGTALASAGFLPAWLGVWLGNVIFTAVAGFLWLSTPT